MSLLSQSVQPAYSSSNGPIETHWDSFTPSPTFPSCWISGAGADAGEVQEQGVEEGFRGREAGAHEARAAAGPEGVLQVGKFLSPENRLNSKIFG